MQSQRKPHILAHLFRPATEEDETEMDPEVEATPNCTGNKRKNRERSRSANSLNPRIPAPAVAGGGKTATWLRMETFEQIGSKLDFGESCGNAREKMANAD